MALNFTLKLVLVLFAAAQGVQTSMHCSSVYYETIITEICLSMFNLDMEALDQHLWCSWPHTLEIYGGLTNCTWLIAEKMDCFWPNQVIDQLFTHVHQQYFHNCALTGRLPYEPPGHILWSFISATVLITLLMTALVVWRSKRSKGVL